MTADKDHKGDACEHDDEADRGKIKKCKCFHSRITQGVADEDVWRRAYLSGQPAQQ